MTGTVAGRVFTTGQPTSVASGGQVRIWVPVLEQTARVGVLAVSVPDADPAGVRQAELLGVFAGLVVGGLTRVSDAPRVRRHGRRMSLPASMQWDLLPPWSAARPRRASGRDTRACLRHRGRRVRLRGGRRRAALRDHRRDGPRARLDAASRPGGGRVPARAPRRRCRSPAMHAAIDDALASDYDDLSFATGILGTLHLSAGRLEWTCAGHPPPLLLRDRRVIRELECAATLPFGLGGGTPVVSTCDLEPGDAVLFYTDGVTDAHPPRGDLFGLGRLADLLERAAASEQQPEELLRRRLVQALLEYQQGDLRDDATLLLLRWTGE